MAKSDYYELLGVARQADAAAIKSAYRKMAKQYHPDHNPNDATAEQKFKAVAEAYDVLKNPQNRAAYDRFGHDAFQQGGQGGGQRGGQQGGGQQGGGFGDINDIFEDFFGGRQQRGGRRQRGQREVNRRGRDLQSEIEISLEDAYHELTRTITIDADAPCKTCNATGGKDGAAPVICPACQGHGAVRTKRGFMTMEHICAQCQGQGQTIATPCPDCRGQGRAPTRRTVTVKIPAGVDTGTRIRLSGEGEAGLRGGMDGSFAGDFYVFVNVRAHTFLEREGANLFCQMPVPMTLAASGGQVDVPLLDAKRVKLTIPPGAQSGHQFRLRGKGMPVLQRNSHGDLYVRIQVEVPEKLTPAQKDQLAALTKSFTDEQYPLTQDFKNRTNKAKAAK